MIKKKLDNALTGLKWLGISSGMGEERAYKKAVKWIQNSSKGDLKIEKQLYSVYNIGLLASKKYLK